MGTLFWLFVLGIFGWFVYKTIGGKSAKPTTTSPTGTGAKPDTEALPRLSPTGSTACLSQLNLIHLKSLREEPGEKTLGAGFQLPSDALKTGVIYTCVQSSTQLWTHTWLFEEEVPDLFEHEPVAEVVIGSSGHVSLNMGFPSNYRAVVLTLQKQDLL